MQADLVRSSDLNLTLYIKNILSKFSISESLWLDFEMCLFGSASDSPSRTRDSDVGCRGGQAGPLRSRVTVTVF